MKNIIWLSPSLAAGAIAGRLVAFFKRRPQMSRRRGNLRPPPAPPGEEINAGLKGGVAALGIAGAMATAVMPAVPAPTICLDRERGFSEDFIVTDGTANQGLTSEQRSKA
jgi:hypothetical protein